MAPSWVSAEHRTRVHGTCSKSLFSMYRSTAHTSTCVRVYVRVFVWGDVVVGVHVRVCMCVQVCVHVLVLCIHCNFSFGIMINTCLGEGIGYICCFIFRLLGD